MEFYEQQVRRRVPLALADIGDVDRRVLDPLLRTRQHGLLPAHRAADGRLHVLALLLDEIRVGTPLDAARQLQQALREIKQLRDVQQDLLFLDGGGRTGVGGTALVIRPRRLHQRRDVLIAQMLELS